MPKRLRRFYRITLLISILLIVISIKLMLKPSPFKDIAKDELGTTIGEVVSVGFNDISYILEYEYEVDGVTYTGETYLDQQQKSEYDSLHKNNIDIEYKLEDPSISRTIYSDGHKPGNSLMVSMTLIIGIILFIYSIFIRKRYRL